MHDLFSSSFNEGEHDINDTGAVVDPHAGVGRTSRSPIHEYFNDGVIVRNPIFNHHEEMKDPVKIILFYIAYIPQQSHKLSRSLTH